MEFRDEMDQNNDEEVVNKLVSMFGNVVTQDVITAVVESCAGDLNQSVEAVMNIAGDASTSEASEATRKSNKPKHGSNSPNQKKKHTSKGDKSKKKKKSETGENSANQQNFAAALQSSVSKGTENRPVSNPTPNTTSIIWTNQLRDILTCFNQGSRIMIIMRGASGSGKSFLAKKVVDYTVGPSVINYGTHIFSSDDYFMNTGQYVYDKSKLPDAHMWNQQRVKMAAHDGLSPIIVDNTNIVIWEMETYVRNAVCNGYIIDLMESNTPWAKKAYHLYQRNSHNVPMSNIKRMLEHFQDGLTGEILMKTYGLSYSPPMVPPILRNIPGIVSNDVTSASSKVTPSATPRLTPAPKSLHIAIPVQPVARTSQSTIGDTADATSNSSDVDYQFPNITNLNLGQSPQNCDDNAAAVSENESNTSPPIELNDTSSDNEKENLSNEELQDSDSLTEALQRWQKSELEWENGEHWGAEETAKCDNVDSNRSFEPKSQRKRNGVASESPNISPDTEVVMKSAQRLMKSINKCEDWNKISMFMFAWSDPQPVASTSSNAPAIPVDTVSSVTSMDIGDTEISNNIHKIIDATSRDINMYYESFGTEKIPDMRMLDKSTTTHEELITKPLRCKNEEKHFVSFRKLFKNISKACLRDIFDRCEGDVNWAVDIVFDDKRTKELLMVDANEMSDEEEETFEPCACLAAYNIIPDISTETVTNNEQIVTDPPEAVPQIQKKAKKETEISQASIQLKRQIEKNVVIAEDHYSDHCLKIRKIRRGEYNRDDEIAGSSSAPDTSATEVACDQFLDDEDENNDFDGENTTVMVEKYVSMKLGSDFVKQLDDLFGRNDMEYPECIVPKISVPMSILNEINALWMESVMNQLEEQSRQSELMIQQDEEFARQIAAKEEEMALAGIEPPVPNFKEIMDMDVALALYQKDAKGWRKHEPKDLAAKLTRDKLYFLFPDVPQDTLAEMLLAHDYNFKNTVEVLLVSTGKGDILKKKSGVNKFVLEKEIERKEKILQEERKALLDAEWPFLPNKDEVVDMDTVNNYRSQAQKHMMFRSLYFNKAREFISRGMTQVASYYSELASFQKQRFDYTNHLAVASLMQVHAANAKDTETIDLHLMRVTEAIQTIDMFIDAHIELLKKSRERGGDHNTHLYIITGRGLHSIGGPKVKPAVGKRLQVRRIRFFERNPGLLVAKVSADDKLTYQIP